MKYGKIDKKTLNTVIADYYNFGDYTLKDALDHYGEDIVTAQYLLKKGKFEFFLAWSENYSFILLDDMMACGEKYLLGLKRNPPELITIPKRKKRNGKR